MEVELKLCALLTRQKKKKKKEEIHWEGAVAMPFAFANTEGMHKQNARALRDKWLSVFFKKTLATDFCELSQQCFLTMWFSVVVVEGSELTFACQKKKKVNHQNEKGPLLLIIFRFY